MTEQRRDDRATDASVDAAWRLAAGEQPAAEVDAAILAAARAAVRPVTQERLPAPPPSRRWTRWQPLAAAAGVIGLSFLLVQMLPGDQLARPPAKQDAPQAPVAESAPATTAPAPSPHVAPRLPVGLGPDCSAGLSLYTSVFCGAQAAVAAFGRDNGPNTFNWVEEYFDYENQLGVASGTLWGLKKTQ